MKINQSTEQFKIFVINHTWAVPVQAKTKTVDKVSQTLLSAPKLRLGRVFEDIAFRFAILNQKCLYLVLSKVNDFVISW